MSASDYVVAMSPFIGMALVLLLLPPDLYERMIGWWYRRRK